MDEDCNDTGNINPDYKSNKLSESDSIMNVAPGFNSKSSKDSESDRNIKPLNIEPNDFKKKDDAETLKPPSSKRESNPPLDQTLEIVDEEIEPESALKKKPEAESPSKDDKVQPDDLDDMVPVKKPSPPAPKKVEPEPPAPPKKIEVLTPEEEALRKMEKQMQMPGDMGAPVDKSKDEPEMTLEKLKLMTPEERALYEMEKKFKNAGSGGMVSVKNMQSVSKKSSKPDLNKSKVDDLSMMAPVSKSSLDDEKRFRSGAILGRTLNEMENEAGKVRIDQDT